MFCCKRETTLFGLPKEDTTRHQWLRCIHNTVPDHKYWSVCHAFYAGLSLEPGRVAYNVNTINGCEHYKVRQFQLCKNSPVLLAHSL